MGVGVLGQLHPLRHDVFLAVGQITELLGELSRQGENGVGHPLVIGFCVGQTSPGQKFPVHVLPDIVGINEGAVHIK